MNASGIVYCHPWHVSGTGASHCMKVSLRILVKCSERLFLTALVCTCFNHNATFSEN